MKCFKALTLAMVLFVFSTLPVFATAESEKVGLVLSFSEGAPTGSTLKVELQCTTNPGLGAAQFILGFDHSVLECISVKTGIAMAEMMAVTNPKGEQGAVVAGISANDVIETGTLAVFAFKVLQSGSYGFYAADAVFSSVEGSVYELQIEGLEGKKPDTVIPETPVQPSNPDAAGTFTDTKNHWAEVEIEKAAALGLVEGHGNGLFGPDENMTRAQFVTILWRNAGKPEPQKKTTFTDLDPAMTYYHKAVTWAEENQIVEGIGGNRFDPEGNITREQVAVILHRMSGEEIGGEILFASIYEKAFTDSNHISDWAKAAVYWALYQEIWCGTNNTGTGDTLAATEAATRAQVAVMLVRYQKP